MMEGSSLPFVIFYESIPFFVISCHCGATAKYLPLCHFDWGVAIAKPTPLSFRPEWSGSGTEWRNL